MTLMQFLDSYLIVFHFYIFLLLDSCFFMLLFSFWLYHLLWLLHLRQLPIWPAPLSLLSLLLSPEVSRGGTVRKVGVLTAI